MLDKLRERIRLLKRLYTAKAEVGGEGLLERK